MITKLLSPNTPNPKTAGPNGDWDLAMAQLTAVKKLLAGEQMMLTEWTNATNQPKIALGTHIQHKGSIYVVDTEDYALPVLGGNGTYYIVLEEDGETLVGSQTTSLAGFAWDATYNGLYNGGKLALPYQVVKSSSWIAKRKILNPWSTGAFSCVNYLGVVYGPSIEVSGGITAGGSIAASGNITATGKLTGATINTGQGDVEAYPMDQAVRTTDAVKFKSLEILEKDVWEIFIIPSDGYVVPVGIYYIKGISNSASYVKIYVNGWNDYATLNIDSPPILVVSTGDNINITRQTGTSAIRVVKF